MKHPKILFGNYYEVTEDDNSITQSPITPFNKKNFNLSEVKYEIKLYIGVRRARASAALHTCQRGTAVPLDQESL